jgi:hypothetical protein
VLQVLKYPASNGNTDAHTDYGCVTMLLPGDTGLQVGVVVGGGWVGGCCGGVGGCGVVCGRGAIGSCANGHLITSRQTQTLEVCQNNAARSKRPMLPGHIASRALALLVLGTDVSRYGWRTIAKRALICI